ncbi:MAG TPA: nucleotidyltransferase domain-containing protein [Anaerolineales bacterium]|nr:nucleotidyltransferase domain-containing protein [Anaerolineales bacterium]
MVAKQQSSLGLLPKEKRAVREFISRIRSDYGEKIQHAALFGSKTRKNWTKSSDVDILLIVAEQDKELRKAIIYTAADVELKYDVLLDVRIIPAERWQYYADIKAGLYKNITRDAVPIRFPRTKSNALAGAG